ncbi:hypothetical protein OQI_38235 [Streptomyces pharetrae CZA14]|uniref:DNA primase/polymerase bifunctional N-terminal domain-containing protein n=1 Tax=Streptomyces pharetrae CZA14 TaxID=1144883 RepID=A0ABX3Y7B0_9ACTN|nr:hypothetical protein OQI_38235 [Streptomyces pharetrae CZA14]
MSSPTRPEALAPVEPEAGTLVHTTADRQLAAEHWLAAAHPNAAQVRWEWVHRGVALLPLGTLFSAARIPTRLVRAVAEAERRSPNDCLAAAFKGGPVIYDPHSEHYYALVPGSMPHEWREAAAEWPRWGAALLGRDTLLGVPRVSATAAAPGECPSHWAVPMPSAGELCDPMAVATFVTSATWFVDREDQARS